MNLTFQPIPVALDDEKLDGRLVLADSSLIAILVRLSPSDGQFAGKWFAEALFGSLAEEGNPLFNDLEEARKWVMARMQLDQHRSSPI